MDMPLVFFRKLVKPHIRILGNQDHAWHPFFILAEALIFGRPVKGQHGRIATETTGAGAAQRFLLDKVNAA